MGGPAAYRLFFACLTLFWDLTDGRWVEACPPPAQAGDSHALSDVFPYSLRFKQQVLTNVVALPALFRCGQIALAHRRSSDSIRLQYEFRTNSTDGLQPLYALMSLQR